LFDVEPTGTQSKRRWQPIIPTPRLVREDVKPLNISAMHYKAKKVPDGFTVRHNQVGHLVELLTPTFGGNGLLPEYLRLLILLRFNWKGQKKNQA
jgi:hypothetical protein